VNELKGDMFAELLKSTVAGMFDRSDVSWANTSEMCRWASKT
jgi:hypothetical protein